MEVNYERELKRLMQNISSLSENIYYLSGATDKVNFEIQLPHETLFNIKCINAKNSSDIYKESLVLHTAWGEVRLCKDSP